MQGDERLAQPNQSPLPRTPGMNSQGFFRFRLFDKSIAAHAYWPVAQRKSATPRRSRSVVRFHPGQPTMGTSVADSPSDKREAGGSIPPSWTSSPTRPSLRPGPSGTAPTRVPLSLIVRIVAQPGGAPGSGPGCVGSNPAGPTTSHSHLDVAQPGGARALEARGRRFESARRDHFRMLTLVFMVSTPDCDPGGARFDSGTSAHTQG
jgi:hypothetical protein